MTMRSLKEMTYAERLELASRMISERPIRVLDLGPDEQEVSGRRDAPRPPGPCNAWLRDSLAIRHRHERAKKCKTVRRTRCQGARR